jgi:hypothetical protein
VRKLVVVLLLGVVAGSSLLGVGRHLPAARAAEAGPATEAAEIRRVIEGQLDAFRRDDGEGAFAFASPSIRAMFGDAATFLGMVRTGYPPVYRPREVEFRSLGVEEGRLTQRVLLVGPDGVPVVARYYMEQQPDGSWRIGGCVLEAAPDVTT